MNDSLHRVAELARLLEAHRRTEQEDLPELMREIGLTEIKLADGSEITVTDDVQCSISEERRAAAHAWLRESGYGGIIKGVLAIPFRPEDPEMEEAVAEIAAEASERLGAEIEVAEKVHPQTLKSFVKERLAAGEAVPFDLFGIHPFSRAKVKAPKRARR